MVMGAPVSTRLERWAMARSVVAGRFVNAYSRRDWVLGLIYRGANGKSQSWDSCNIECQPDSTRKCENVYSYRKSCLAVPAALSTKAAYWSPKTAKPCANTEVAVLQLPRA